MDGFSHDDSVCTKVLLFAGISKQFCGFLLPARGADALHQVAHALRLVTARNVNRRNRNIVQAEGAAALGAVEVYVHVVVLVVVMAQAQFVAHAVAGIFQDMDQVCIAEGGECPEDIALVNGLDIGRKVNLTYSSSAWAMRRRLAVTFTP